MLNDLTHLETDREQDRAREAYGSDETGVCHGYKNALEVARHMAPDVPIFCFSEAALALRLKLFQDGFPGDVTYAVKANPSPEVIRTLVRCGMDTFDVASPAEMELVRSFSRRATLHYHNPIKSRSEIERAYHSFNVRHLAVDDAAEVDKIADVVKDRRDVELVVRFRAARNRALCDFSGKFGADVEQATNLLQRADQMGFATSLTFHPGSQCLDPVSYVENIEAAAEISRGAGVRLRRLNVGGGFPIDYPGHPVPPPAAFFRAIDAATRRAFGNDRPKLIAEPGRALVAGCTSLLARVKHRRPACNELFLNDGIYGALMELTQFSFDLPCRAIRDGRLLDGPKQTFVAYGPTCDPGDRIPRTVDLPAGVSEGDWIEFGLVGAYGAATTTRFNGYGTIPSVNVDAVLSA